MFNNAKQAARAKWADAVNQPSLLFEYMKWRGEAEMHITIRFGYNSIRRDAMLEAFKRRYNGRLGVWEDFYNWQQVAVQHLSLGRLPHLPLDDAIEATLDSP